MIGAHTSLWSLHACTSPLHTWTSPDVILCGWLDSKHQLTNSLSTHEREALEFHFQLRRPFSSCLDVSSSISFSALIVTLGIERNASSVLCLKDCDIPLCNSSSPFQGCDIPLCNSSSPFSVTLTPLLTIYKLLRSKETFESLDLD